MVDNWLPRVLEESRARGFLSPGPLERHIQHSQGFVEAWNSVEQSSPRSFLDLGSGGGVPGLILATVWPVRAVLLDSMIRRTSFLTEVSSWEDAPRELEVVTGRAEAMGRRHDLREQFDLVVSRSFGPPAVAAECASAFVKVGGLIIVSEPPDDEKESRWPDSPLLSLGLEPMGRLRVSAAFQLLRKIEPLDIQYPRKVGIPGKTPLF